MMAEMIRVQCKSTFRVYEPLEPYRSACPKVLVVCRGPHTHPIPQPLKTPPIVRLRVFRLLEKLGTDLADLTPRRFLRHSILSAHLREAFPHNPYPTPSDLHVSLSNREHLRVYILNAQNKAFPEGTGWEGLLHLKARQDDELPPEDHYIRFAAEVPSLSGIIHEEDDETEPGQPAQPIRVIICMSKQSSQRLVKTQFLQSDIGFKRIVGFQEFELGGKEFGSNSGMFGSPLRCLF